VRRTARKLNMDDACAQAWPTALEGRDCLAIAKTGSGKTAGCVGGGGSGVVGDGGVVWCGDARVHWRAGLGFTSRLVVSPGHVLREAAVLSGRNAHQRSGRVVCAIELPLVRRMKEGQCI